jgi:competence protein ComEA
VPEPLRNARIDPGRRGVVVLLLVAAIAAVATAVGVWRDRPEPRPIETTTVAAVSGSDSVHGSPTAGPGMPAGTETGSAGPEPTSGGSAATEIVVSVTGLVANPGVVRLPAQARVADAIAVAGGTLPDADLTGMNLAAKLADGDSVVVGNGAAQPGSAASSSGSGSSRSAAGTETPQPSGLVNLNTADEAALDTLPGVGPVMAQNIIAWRESNGRFTSVEQLQEISGIGPARYAQISGLVTVG